MGKSNVIEGPRADAKSRRKMRFAEMQMTGECLHNFTARQVGRLTLVIGVLGLQRTRHSCFQTKY